MTPHLLKTDDTQFAAVWDGTKSFEARKDDREFHVGDILILGERTEVVEWDYGQQRKTGEWYWTGRVIVARVVHVLRGGQYGIEEGHCVMSIDVLTRSNYQNTEAQP